MPISQAKHVLYWLILMLKKQVELHDMTSRAA